MPKKKNKARSGPEQAAQSSEGSVAGEGVAPPAYAEMLAETLESSPKPSTPPPAAQIPSRVRQNILLADPDQPDGNRLAASQPDFLPQAPMPASETLRAEGEGTETSDVGQRQGLETGREMTTADLHARAVEPEGAVDEILDEAPAEQQPAQDEAPAEQQPALPEPDEEASRRAAYELAAAIAEEEERREKLEKVNAEYMKEVERRRTERESSSAGPAGHARLTEKQEVVPKTTGPPIASSQTDQIDAASKPKSELLEEQRHLQEMVRREAEAAARELEMQGLAWSEREVRERAERERTALLQRQQAIDVKDQVSVSPSLAAAVPEQHLQCLTAWVNSALPEGMMMSDPSALLSTPMALTLLAERLAGQVIEGVDRKPESQQQHQHNLALSLQYLHAAGANKFCTEYQTLSCGGTAAVCDLLWEMAERFVMEPQFLALAQESSDLHAYSEQGWMEGARSWVRLMTGVVVDDFADGFQDGRVFLAIVAAAWPGSQIDLEATVRDNSAEEVLELALSIAQRRWHVPRLFSPPNLLQGAEPACVLLYLALLANRLPFPAGDGGDSRIVGRSIGPQTSSAAIAGVSRRQVMPEIAPPAGGVEDSIRVSGVKKQAADEERPAAAGMMQGEGRKPGLHRESGGKDGVAAGAVSVIAAQGSHLDRVGGDNAKVACAVPDTEPYRNSAQHNAPPMARGRQEVPQGRAGRCSATCSSCHEPLVRPRLLRCLHIFCLPCLEGIVELRGQDSWAVRCPACEMATPVGRAGENNSLEMMNSDEGVLKIMALLSDHASTSDASAPGAPARPSACDNCLQANATLWCGACEAALCVQCSAQVHGFRSITAGKQHNPTKLQPGERVPTRLPTCQVHPGEKLLFLSISSQQLICRECVLVGGHDKDRYVAVEDAGRQTRVDLTELIKQVEDVEQQVDRAIQDAARRAPTVMDTYRARTQHLSARAEALKTAMQERKQVVLHEIDEERDRKSQRLLMQGVSIGRVAVALEHGASMGRLLMKRGNDLEVLRASQSLERLLRASSAIAVSGAPVEGPALFSGGDDGPSYNLVPTTDSEPSGSLTERISALSVAPSHHRPLSKSQQFGGGRAIELQIPHPVPAPSTRADSTQGRSKGTGGSQSLLSLPQAILTPKRSMTNSPNDASSVSGAGVWAARSVVSNGAVQQVNGVRGMSNGKVGWGARSGQSLFAIGGFDGAANLETMEFFDSSSGAWRQAPSMNCARRGLAAASHEGRIYVVGGWDGRKYLDSMAIFDTFTGRWTAGPAMLSPRCFAAAAFVGPHLYVVGGYYGATNLRSAERYDAQSNEWLTLPNMATARRGLGAAACQDRLLLAIGGWDGKMNLKTVECLDVRGQAGWTMLAPLKVPRCSLSCASSGNLIYVCGGWDGSDYLASVECLHPEGKDQEWKMLTRMNTPRSYCAACVCTSIDAGKQLVVVGGWDGVGTRRLASSEALSIAELEVKGHVTSGAFIGAWSALPTMTAARYGGAVVAV